MSDNWRVALPVAAGVLALDQATKFWVEHTLPYHLEHELLPFLSLYLTYNPGAAFSFLHDAGGWQRPLLIGVSVAIMAWIALWIHRLSMQERKLVWPLALILGGAAGNLFDRVRVGAVTDFIVLHYARDWTWPTFNIADAAISVGVVLLLVWGFRRTSN